MAGEENKNMNELPTPYVTVEGITEYRLANGLKVVLIRMPANRRLRST